MLVRRLPMLALLAGLPIVLANCGSDSSDGGSAGSPPAVAGSPGTAGTAAAGGPSAAGSPAVGGGGSTSVGGGGATSVGGGGATSLGGSGGASAGSGGASAGAGGSGGKAGSGAGGGSGGGTTGTFALTSPDHAEGAKFAKDYTCDAMNGTFGAGVNPELNWSGAPSGTMSYAITFIDTTIGDNMAMGQHWAIWNIPATVTKFPKGTKTLTGDLAMAKQNGAFLTPCAQSLMNGMDDQYEFTVYAIPTATLNVTGMSVANALAAIKALSPAPAKATLHGHAGLKGK